MTYTRLNMEQYSRKAHFEYFKGLAYPYVGTTANVDITNFYPALKARKRPFFLSVLYECANAANAVPEFRHRILGDSIVQFDACPTSHTVMKEDGTFAYCQLDCARPFDEFLPHAIEAQERAKNGGDIHEDEAESLSLFFITTLPWLTYTSLIQPVPAPADSNPRISWGKFFEAEGKLLMPVTILANHALVDGKHLSEFYENLSKRLDCFEK